MPGLRIMFRLVDIGYSEPTKIYDILQNPDGTLKMVTLLSGFEMSLDDIAHYLLDQEVRRPIVLVDPHPPFIEFFKSRGIRVR